MIYYDLLVIPYAIYYLICYFCHIQICNDDCWVICILFANVKSLFDHVTRRYDIASLGAESERQDLQVHTRTVHLPNDAFQT